MSLSPFLKKAIPIKVRKMLVSMKCDDASGVRNNTCSKFYENSLTLLLTDSQNLLCMVNKYSIDVIVC